MKTIYGIILAAILGMCVSCQPTQILTAPSPAPSSAAALAAATETETATVTPPHDLVTSLSTFIVFPQPTKVSAESFGAPDRQEMTVGRPADGQAWITYTPPDWPGIYQRDGEYPIFAAIVERAEGDVWFATKGGLAINGTGIYRFDGNSWINFRKGHGLPFNDINALAVSTTGGIWMGGTGVTYFDGNYLTTYTTKNGLASNDVRSLASTSDGALWVGTVDRGLSWFDGKGWQSIQLQNPNNYIGRIFILPDNSILISSSNDHSARLVYFDGRTWSDYETPWSKQGKYTVDVAWAMDGDLWFATEFSGVYRFSQNTWTNFSIANGLPSAEIHSVAVARDGSVWVGTSKGLARYDGKKWKTIELPYREGIEGIGPITATSDGSIWLAFYGGLAQIDPSEINFGI